MNFFFVSDLHGSVAKFKRLFLEIEKKKPDALLIGGDILPGGDMKDSAGLKGKDFIYDFLQVEFKKLKSKMGDRYPDVFIILGNDDGRSREVSLIDAGLDGLWKYPHNRFMELGYYSVCGYSYIPPSPFYLKDWEKYDVSRYVDPGCVAPADGMLSVPVSDYELNYGTIAEDLSKLIEGKNLDKTIFLFHAPPYKTALDRAALDGKFIDYVPLDVHIGSIAIKEMIKDKEPMLTLHGHVHESSGITGKWRENIGDTAMFSAAYDGEDLALVQFDPEKLADAERLILSVDS